MVQKQHIVSRNHTPKYAFGSFLELRMGGVMLSCDARQPAAAPSQPQNHKGSTVVLYSTLCF
jgi:hypothetical protein